ncbi:SDR family NAD(P)-dependent oxidoreductase [Conexibacter sp. S30A1]|uniref:SDR family NAD(P)-dependent oxidoreductase n=1 Tax=Conexibacter sp. S30A1 TaxID=2937800 RepID=UPI00200EC7C7|nr:SDR family oxidoreductase [Conexibacter sp. S30A1]
MATESRRSVIVTGAGGGMGAAAVRQLVKRNVNVLAVDLRPQSVELLKSELADAPAEVLPVAGDAADAETVQAFVALAITHFGRLDGVFNIAGVGTGEFRPLAEVQNATYDEVMRVNAKSVWLGMKYALPHLVAGGGGTIVNTGSHLAWHAAPTFSAYCASKHAVIGMTKAVALEYGRDNVRANIVCPSAMETAMGQEAAEGIDPEDPRAGWQVMIDQSANGRVARPEETAAVGVWLLLDAPQHVSGVVFPVDGAQSAK